jgi:hypothetical protein
MEYTFGLAAVMILLIVMIWLITAAADFILSGRRKKGRARDDG